jgi:hypothetical protein
MKSSKPILRIRINNLIQGMKKWCFDFRFERLIHGETSALSNKELMISSPIFHVTQFLKLETDLSPTAKKKLFILVEEEIVGWITKLNADMNQISSGNLQNAKSLSADLYSFLENLNEDAFKKIKPTGRKPSKYKTFEDCLNLNRAEYLKFEGALKNYIHDGTWKPKNKTDYCSLLKALADLKFTNSIQLKPFAAAFCKSYNIAIHGLGHRRKTNPAGVAAFKLLLKKIRLSEHN